MCIGLANEDIQDIAAFVVVVVVGGWWLEASHIIKNKHIHIATGSIQNFEDACGLLHLSARKVVRGRFGEHR